MNTPPDYEPATRQRPFLRWLALFMALITIVGVTATAADAQDTPPVIDPEPDPEPPGDEDPPPPPPPVTFDWSMPDRFGGDSNNDGLIDYYTGHDDCEGAEAPSQCTWYPPTSPFQIAPSTWHVDLDACDSALAAGTGATFTWQVVGGTGTLSGGPGCDDKDLTVSAEGVYKLKLTIASSLGTDTITKDVVVQDWMVVSMGDSYGSGEGNADKEMERFLGVETAPAQWQDERCHRTAKAGSAQAAKWLEDADPHTSVTFIHVSCSGAEALTGLLKGYAGVSDTREAQILPTQRPQITLARQLVQNREVDALYVSIGGNDANFAHIVTACLALNPCNPTYLGLPDIPIPDLTLPVLCGYFNLIPPPVGQILFGICAVGIALLLTLFPGGTAEHWLQDGLIGDGDPADISTYRLSHLYDRVEAALFATEQNPDNGDPYFGLPLNHANRVFLSEYVDATQDDDGSYCPKGNVLQPFNDIRVPGLADFEYSWLDTEVEQKLNHVIAENATDKGWNLVDGIHDRFRTHGLCADDTYMRGLLAESFWIQGDKNAAVHPNVAGHQVYRDRIISKMLPTLYPGTGGEQLDIRTVSGVRNWINGHAPRLPEMAPVADAGGPYTVAEGATKTASNNSYDDSVLTNAWSTDDANVATVAPASAATPTITGVDDGQATLTLGVSDDADDDAESTDTAGVTVTNVAPTVAVPSTTVTVNEGSALSRTATYTDPGTLDTHTAKVNYGDGTPLATPSASSGSVSLSHTFADDEAGAADDKYTVKVDVDDDDNGTGTASFPVTVANLAPTVSPLVAPMAPVPTNSAITASSSYSDAGADDHTVTWSWGDGTSTTQNKNVDADGPISASHSYTTSGLYTVRVTVDDHDGGVISQEFESVVVFDPSGGFVTGGGIIDSPTGALVGDPAATGPATFAFVSKYVKTSNTPTGNTQFRFNAGNFELSSTAYEWLVVSGARAQYKGTATVNDQPGFGFLLTAIDGARLPGGGPDKLRVKVWNTTTGTIVYDNQVGAPDAANPTTSIKGGQIAIGGK
jgi:hypothetical protein